MVVEATVSVEHTQLRGYSVHLYSLVMEGRYMWS